MDQADNKKQTSFIDVPQLIKAYIVNWKWVVASVIVFLGLGVLVFLKQANNVEVQAQVLVSDESSSQASSLGDIASMFGGGGSFGSNRSIEDEMVVIKSHSLLKQTVKDLNLNESYVVEKNFLKKTNVYYNPPIKLIYDKRIVDTLSVVLRFDVDVDAQGLLDIKVRGYKRKVIFKTSQARLPLDFETPYGKFTLVAGSSFIDGESLSETINLSSYDYAALGLSEDITVDLSAKKTDIMLLNYITSDADFGKSVLNTLIDNYNALTIRQKQSFHVKTLEFLEDRIRILSAEVDSTQSMVEDFMGRRDLVNPEAQASIYISRTSTQEVELIKAESEFELLNMAIEFLSNEANNTSMLPIMPSTASLTPLINGYNELILNRLELESSAKGDNMALKAINARINAVRDNLLAALNKQSETANFEIKELRNQYAKSKGKLGTMPGIEREYTNILREQTLKEQLYVYLLRQREETEMAIAGAHPRGVIIDEAFVTDSILGLSPKIILIVFFILGMFVPGALILLKWSVGRKISIINQAVNISGGKQLIANIPLSNASEPIVISAPDNVEAKRVRLLRGNVLTIETLPEKFVLAVIGTTDDNESSRVALNLAVSMAMTGRKIALIEANPFDPVIGKLVDVKYNGPCDVNYKGLNSGLIRATDDVVVDFVSFDQDESFGADKLASVGFCSLVRDMTGEYDVVVLSAPSVDSHFASVETINNLTDVFIATIEIGKTKKCVVEKLSHLDDHNNNAYLVEVSWQQ